MDSAVDERAPVPQPPFEELKLLSEQVVDGMPTGNLSGLAWCGDALWTVSDRDDDRLYRLSANGAVLNAEVEVFQAPPPPQSPLPWGVRVRNWLSGLTRGGALDFEGLSCDAKGNRYLVSEATSAVLMIPPAGSGEWLNLPASLVSQARASGMLLHFNALFEGLVVDAKGDRLWLAAERERRGLLVLHKINGSWKCAGGCVLMSEGGDELPPPQMGTKPMPKDFSDIAFYKGHLYTLERLAHQICRRAADTGEAEHCWSFANEALTDARKYDEPWGMAEALTIDEKGAWIGVDNGNKARGDGEDRPIVWRFAAPAAGWSAKP
ncbi:esterase-like activity of phytase family protein [Pseudomonas sp. TE3786]